MQTLKLIFGAMAPKLAEQLKSQNFSYNKVDMIHFQKDADAIVRLKVRGLITAFETEKATNKLIKSIKKHIESRLQETDFK